MFLGQIKVAKDTSFLGRYLAARSLDDSIFDNYDKIETKIDPTGAKKNNIFLSKEDFKKQRQLGYHYMPDTLKRMSNLSYLQNMIAAGAGGAFIGSRRAFIGNDDLTSPEGLAAVIGGTMVGAGLGAAGTAYNNFKKNKISYDDIKAMADQQRDHSKWRGLIPFSDMVDAYRAGNQPYRTVNDTTKGNSVTDVDQLINWARNKKPDEFEVASLPEVSRDESSGFSRARYHDAELIHPILLNNKNEVLDGRHRLLKARDQGLSHILGLRVPDDVIAKHTRAKS